VCTRSAIRRDATKLRTKQTVHVWISRVAIGLIGATYSQAGAQPYTFTTLAGTENVGGVGLAIDKEENIYVAGYSNHVVVKVTPTGQATTIAGVFGEPGNNDGPALSARFREPYGGIKKGVPSRETPASRVVNFSVRGRVDANAGGLIVGFVTSDIFAKRMVIRGIGPSLGSFGVHDSVSGLELRLNRADGTQISENTNWAGNPSLSEAFARVGAFPLPVNSTDTAISLFNHAGLR
jgi:hypothetical protein